MRLRIRRKAKTLAREAAARVPRPDRQEREYGSGPGVAGYSGSGRKKDNMPRGFTFGDIRPDPPKGDDPLTKPWVSRR